MIVMRMAARRPASWLPTVPCYPFLFVWTAAVLVSRMKHSARNMLVWCLRVACSVCSAAAQFPHHPGYFNEFAGGGQNGWRHLSGSNIDWGQDLINLRDWVTKNSPQQPIFLAYQGLLEPEDLGIKYRPARFLSPGPNVEDNEGSSLATDHLTPRYYAISVNLLRGTPAHIPVGANATCRVPQGAYSYLLDFEPDAMAGYSIYIFHLDERRIRTVADRFLAATKSSFSNGLGVFLD